MKKVTVGIAGAAGYTGCELIRLLESHPHAEISWLMTGQTHAGKTLKEVFPHLRWTRDRVFSPLDAKDAGGAEVVFMAMPHGVAAAVTSRFLQAGCRVIDLSADYRLKDPDLYERTYQKRHDAPELLPEAVYGLTELYRERLRAARLIAVPGCYPTVSILALAPLLSRDLAALDAIVIDAKSGLSGAGRGLTLGTHFAECNEDFLAYKPMEHRHIPEIEQELALLAGEQVAVCFVPHLVPMTRGMLATVFCRPAKPDPVPDLQEVYAGFYRDEPFVQVLGQGELPRTKNVWGTNRCEIAVRWDPRTRTILVVAVIDNLVKGASGQAVQDLNVMCGFPETAGLDRIGLYP